MPKKSKTLNFFHYISIFNLILVLGQTITYCFICSNRNAPVFVGLFYMGAVIWIWYAKNRNSYHSSDLNDEGPTSRNLIVTGGDKILMNKIGGPVLFIFQCLICFLFIGLVTTGIIQPLWKGLPIDQKHCTFRGR